MFYDRQEILQQLRYKDMLSIIGRLSRLFSDSDCPYLPYRIHENIFCKYFEANNLARSDCSADAQKGRIGIGLKTWTGGNDQKIAEFGRLKPTYDGLSGLDLVKKISTYRNERIRVTKTIHGIDDMLYHVVKREIGKFIIAESSFNYIDIENIRVLKGKALSANNTYFTDGNNTYHFSSSKNTLYKIFDDLIELDSLEVSIMEDPYTFLLNHTDMTFVSYGISKDIRERTICLRLYSVGKDGKKFVPLKSGLNQWNASGRLRHPDEIYIPLPAKDRKKNEEFFPPRDTPFDLKLPDGTMISAKVCQEDGKAIMSNPNRVLGEWLLRKVFDLKEGTLLTYEMLEIFGIDCVIFTKLADNAYCIDFAQMGTYEMYNSETS